MKSEGTSGTLFPGTPARHLGTVLLSRISGGSRGRWEGETPSRIVFMVTLDAAAYPLKDHCRYAVPRDPASARTFANTEFKESLPGLRVGPWPGWRGIPEMPPLFLEWQGKEIPFRYQWWGDEFATGKVRATCATTGEGEFFVRSSDPRLVPLRAELYDAPVEAVVPIPLPAGELRHPRLLITEVDLPRLRDLKLPGRERSRELLFSFIERWNIPLRKTPESKIPDGHRPDGQGPEGLGPEDRLLIGALIALLEPGEENGARAVAAYRTYLTLTQEKDFEPLTIDTQSGEVLYLLCVGYDWLHELLTPGEREEAREWIWRVAEICWNHLGYERDDYAQAHYLGCGMGLLAFSLLFPDEHPRAREWGAHLNGVLHWVVASLPPDGYFAHGLNLWVYEFGFLLRWLELIRKGAGIDLYAPALAAASRFRGAATSPDGRLGLTMGDPQFRVGGDAWCHYLIAARSGSGEAQWLGDLLRDTPPDGVDFRNAPARRRVYEYLWRDGTILPLKPEEEAAVFGDGGQVFLRTENSLLTIRSGSPLGLHRYGRGISGAYGHSDPCNGSFLLYQGGRFIVSSPGPVYRRESGLHNIVTVDGQGQVGDTAVWLPDFLPPEVLPPPPQTRAEKGGMGMEADLGRAYLPHLGVVTMRRSLQVRPGRWLAGLDTVELSDSRSIAWQIHSRGRFLPSETGGEWMITFPERGARLVLIEPSGPAVETGETEFVPAYPHDGAGDFFLRFSLRGKKVRFLWALLVGDEPLPVVERGESPQLRFADGSLLHVGGISLRRG